MIKNEPELKKQFKEALETEIPDEEDLWYPYDGKIGHYEYLSKLLFNIIKRKRME